MSYWSKAENNMTIYYVNTGSSPNAGNGDSLRIAFTKINRNFEQVTSQLSAIESGSTSTLVAGTGTFAITTSGTLVLNGHPFNAGNVDLGNYNFSGNILQADNPIFRANDASLVLAVNTSTWTFNDNGTLTFPITVATPVGQTTQAFGMGNLFAWQDGDNWVIASGNPVTGAWGENPISISPGIESNGYLYIPHDAHADTNPAYLANTNATGKVQILASSHTWTFGDNSNLTIPGDIQDDNGSVIRVASTSTAPARVNGQLWFNNSEGRLYIKDNGTWVDANPTVIPPPSTYLDEITVEGSTFTINGSSLTIDETGTLLVNGSQVSGNSSGIKYATIQEGITSHPITSLTGTHTGGLSLTSDDWAQLMWVPNTSVVTLNDIDNGGARYNWVYVDPFGFNIENKTSSSQSWIFDNKGSIELPQYGYADSGVARLQSHDGYPTLMAYGSSGPFGLHGGPELDWMDSDSPDQDFYNTTTTRHTMYLNNSGLYVGLNENGVVGNPQVSLEFVPNGNILWSNPSTATLSTFNDFVISTNELLSTKTWTFAADGTTTFPNSRIDAKDNLTLRVSGVPNAVTGLTGNPQGGWSGSYTNLTTTGGSGTGLTVNASESGSGYIDTVTIVTPGHGYTNGDTITITSGEATAYFTISILPAKSWTFGGDGALTLPTNGYVVPKVSHYASTANATVEGATAIDVHNNKVFLAPLASGTASYTLADGVYDGQTIEFYPEWAAGCIMTDVQNIWIFVSKIFDINTIDGQYGSGAQFPWYPFQQVAARTKVSATWNAQQSNWVLDPGYGFYD